MRIWFSVILQPSGVSLWVDTIRTPPLQNLRHVPGHICSLHANGLVLSSYQHVCIAAFAILASRHGPCPLRYVSPRRHYQSESKRSQIRRILHCSACTAVWSHQRLPDTIMIGVIATTRRPITAVPNVARQLIWPPVKSSCGASFSFKSERSACQDAREHYNHINVGRLGCLSIALFKHEAARGYSAATHVSGYKEYQKKLVPKDLPGCARLHAEIPIPSLQRVNQSKCHHDPMMDC